MREVARHLRELIVATDDYRRAMAAGIDISTNEASVLGELLHEGAQSPTSIATRTGLTAGSATTLIDRLVSAGLVTRTPHPDDGRRVLVDLSTRGRVAIETMFSLFASTLEDALSRAAPHLADDPELRRSFTGLFHEMATSLRTHAGDPARIRASIDAAAQSATGRPRPTSP
jgi:DNA-binding MarR family transcriptional regulator